MAWRSRTTTYFIAGLMLLTAAGCGSEVPVGKGDAAPASRPVVPDNRSIDGIVYAFSPGSLLGDNPDPPRLGPHASLSVTRAGKVSYSFESRPGTGSGGKVVVKSWDVPPAEAAELLDALVADGLLDAESVPRFTAHHYKVWYGRWQLTSTPATLPPGVVARLLPYIERAHPDWKNHVSW